MATLVGYGGTPGSPVSPLLQSGGVPQRFQEPPEVAALQARAASLPPGRARLRRPLEVVSE